MSNFVLLGLILGVKYARAEDVPNSGINYMSTDVAAEQLSKIADRLFASNSPCATWGAVIVGVILVYAAIVAAFVLIRSKQHKKATAQYKKLQNERLKSVFDSTVSYVEV